MTDRPVPLAAIRRRIHIPLRFAATKARRGGHDLLSRGRDRVAEPHRHAGPLAGPGELGLEAG